mgnify:CR=1 FL=1
MKINRYYLEINSLSNLNEVKSPDLNLTIEKVSPPNIEISKFFYKNIGKNHRWIDRLAWDNLKWTSYLENKNVHTYILKLKDDLVGYFETVNDYSSKSSEIAYFGILDNYIGKKIGGFFLLRSISKSNEMTYKKISHKQWTMWWKPSMGCEWIYHDQQRAGNRSSNIL